MKKLIVFQHLEIESPGMFSDIAKERGFEVEVFRLDLEESLPLIELGDILLILGGPMGIKDIGDNKYPWLKKEVEFIRSILLKDIGIIGVCLGAQLLAYASGGDVEVLKSGIPLKPCAEIGWSEISSKNINSEDQISLILKKPMQVLHWHADRILLPREAELIASSKLCREQLFKIRDKAYGLQFHVESDQKMINRWIENNKEFINLYLGEKGQEILREEEEKMEDLTKNSRIKFINLLFDLTMKNS
tara:strand:+ start:1139 stop:1879 length:741 start_codon:yes stop_codon:yes gene_type:complete